MKYMMLKLHTYNKELYGTHTHVHTILGMYNPTSHIATGYKSPPWEYQPVVFGMYNNIRSFLLLSLSTQ